MHDHCSNYVAVLRAIAERDGFALTAYRRLHADADADAFAMLLSDPSKVGKRAYVTAFVDLAGPLEPSDLIHRLTLEEAASQSFDTASPAGKALLGMLAVFAELQREEIRSRTRRALQAKAERGEALGRTPLGLVREGSGYARCPHTWPVVARILSERAAGATCAGIAAGLNADGIPTATALRGERRGLVTGCGQWSYSSVAKLCRNPRILRAARVN